MNSSSASPLAQPEERNTQLLAVGQQCSDPTCLLIDSLPFKCQHCELSFCQEHFRVNAHKCTKYDESKHNRVAPNCPLCNIPVAIRLGQDPNIRMDIHLESECFVVTGKVKAKTTPLCAKGRCKKVLFSPIRCNQCSQQFCPAHRWPEYHTCSAPAVPASKVKTANPLTSFIAGAKNLIVKASVAGTAAMDAVKKFIANARTAPSVSTSLTSKPPLTFSKIHRRARAERESKQKAMQARAKKGLLSEKEEAILAAEEAAAQEKKDCVIM